MKTISWQKNDVVVDRDAESDKIIDLLHECKDKTSVHFVCSPTAVGKSSLITKVIEKYKNADCDIIRIKTKPCNKATADKAWHYFDEIFHGMSSYYKDMDEFTGLGLSFEEYLMSNQDRYANEQKLSAGLKSVFSSDSKNSLLKNILYLIMRQSFQIDEYSINSIKTDSSINAVLTRKNYISYILQTRKILLISDNFQNIDDSSLACFDEWLNAAIKNKSDFLFEYTLNSNDARFASIKEFLLSYCDQVTRTDLEAMPEIYVMDIINRNVTNLSDDLAFSINVVNHYQNVSNGNLRELIDFSASYERSNETAVTNEMENGTYHLIKTIVKPEGQFILSTLAFHQGKTPVKHARAVFPSKSNFKESVDELLKKNLIETPNDSYISVAHASIVDEWKKHKKEFAEIDAVVYGRLKNYYIGYLNSPNADDRNDAWIQLLHLYSQEEPYEIKSLLPLLEDQIIVSISPDDAWIYIEQLFNALYDTGNVNKNLYFRLLQLCYKLELYANGYDILLRLESSHLLGYSTLMLLYKLSYLAALDQHSLVIELFEKNKNTIDLSTRTGLNILLACLSSYRYVGRIDECISIHNKILRNTKYRQYDEYAIFLRLTNIYLTNKKSIKYAKKSIALLRKQGNTYQEGKSQITYAKLLAGLGYYKKALKELGKADVLLKQYPVRGNVLWVNEADILLSIGKHDDYVWDLLQKSEFTAVTPYDRLTIVLVKLAWCYENADLRRAEPLIKRGEKLVTLEPDFHIHALFYYNAYAIYKHFGYTEKSILYYNKVYALKENSRYIKARFEHAKTTEERIRIQHPWYICYLSFWNHDLENVEEE